MDKVSIIVPTFNVARTLEQCLRSVAAQSYRALELIVMDGGSTDGTLDILRRHEHALAHWRSEPDRGIYDAMNKGAAAASGDWLYFLGGDDELYDPEVLRDVFGRGAPDSDMIYGDVWWSGRRYAGRFDIYTLSRRNICHQAIFLRRAVFERLGGFSLDYPLLADYELNIRVFGDPSARTCYVDRIIARFGDQGSSTRGDPRFEADKQELLRRHLGVPNLKYHLLGLRYRLLKKRSWRRL